MEEIWKDINGYRGLYQVSNLGRVRSLPRVIKRPIGTCMTKERILKTFQLKGGYVNVMLRINGRSVNHNVHRLVAETFIPNINPNYDCINHIDGKKINNRVDNLEWCNHSINCLHSYEKGMSRKDGKLSSEQVLDVRKRLLNGERVTDIANSLNVRKNIISDIKCNRTYRRIR